MELSNHYILILAAGASSRLGRPKQLVEVNKINLLDRVIEEAMDSNYDECLVVLGAHSMKILNHVRKVDHVINEKWADGMGSSLAFGIQTIMRRNAQGVLVAVCDQPFISSELFNRILDESQLSGKGIVTSDYGPSIGPPTYFDQKYFLELIRCHGDRGAKKIIEKYHNDVAYVAFPKGLIDIDTEDDIKKLQT